MSRGLRSYPEERRGGIATKRLVMRTRGLGYWAAIDYYDRLHLPKPPELMVQAHQIAKNITEQTENGDKKDSAARARRPQSGGDSNENSRRKSPGRNNKPSIGDKRRRDTTGLHVSQVTRNIPAMESSRSSSPRYADRTRQANYGVKNDGASKKGWPALRRIRKGHPIIPEATVLDIVRFSRDVLGVRISDQRARMVAVLLRNPTAIPPASQVQGRSLGMRIAAEYKEIKL